jgi:hypothetical protein
MFSEIDRKVGLALYKGEKTPEELAEETGEDIRDIMDSLKKLIKLKIVVKEGYPPKYRLSDNIREALKPEELENVEGIRVTATVEAQAIDEDLVRKALNEIVRGVKKIEGASIVSHNISKIEQLDTGVYSGFVDFKLVFQGLEPLFHFVTYYGPSTIEIKGPEKIVVDAADLQRAVTGTANMIQGYVHYVTKLMTKKELEEFNKRMWQSLFK